MKVLKILDKILFPVSWIIIGLECLLLVATKQQVPIVKQYSSILEIVIPIALTGAVGYLTNWLALFFLFKPYKPLTPLKIQGIIPKNKEKMAVSFGNMVGQKLLNPDAIVEEMKDEVLKLVKNTNQIKKINEQIQLYIQHHENEITEFVTPYIEQQVLDIIDNIATEKNWGILWDEGILPRIKSDETRHFIVKKIIELIRDNADKIINEVRGELRHILWEKLDHWYIPTTKIVNAIMNNFADEESLRTKLDNWLSSEETQLTLRRNLITYADQLTSWMKGYEGQKVMSNIIREIRSRGKNFIKIYIREKVPYLINKALCSEKLHNKLEKDILPGLGNKLAQFIDGNKLAILEKLRLEQRVTDTVKGMDVKDFHTMLNDFLAENFCAIQVLGFVIGAIAGFIQALGSILTATHS